METSSPTLAPAQALEGVRVAARRLEALRPLHVVAAFVVLEWLVILGVALTIRHNGWLWYQGGDQFFFYTTSWLMPHGHLVPTSVGYGWTTVLLPISLVAGPNLLHALPAIILVNVLVLMPAAMAAMYGIGARLGGRLAGYWVLAIWVLAPVVGILYTKTGYHQRYTEVSLPQTLGLTAQSDYPSMVMLAVAAYFLVRTLQTERFADGALAGLFAGFGVGIKPSSALFLPGLVLALLVARRRRASLYVAAGFVLPLLALVVWKWRGLGYLPLFQHARSSALGGERLALGSLVPLPVASLHVGKYLHFDWSHLSWNLNKANEYFFSVHLLIWIVLAGIVALARRSLAVALFAGVWFLDFAIFKGSGADGSIADSSLLRMLIPAIPAFVLLVAALPLLMPRAPRRLPALPVPREWGTRRLRLTAVTAAALAFAVLPAIATAAARPIHRGSTIIFNEQAGPVPTLSSLGLRATVHGHHVTLTWRPVAKAPAAFSYEVLRTDGWDYETYWVDPPSTVVGTTNATTFTDAVEGSRYPWVYHVLVVAAWSKDPAQGDGYVSSLPVSVSVR